VSLNVTETFVTKAQFRYDMFTHKLECACGL